MADGIGINARDETTPAIAGEERPRGRAARHDGALPQPRFWCSLSGRLLIFSVIIVLLAEIVIFIPSIARYRLEWLKMRLQSAHVAALTLEARGFPVVEYEWQTEILDSANIHALSLRRDGVHEQVLGMIPASATPPIFENLDELRPMLAIWRAFRTFFAGDEEIQIAYGTPRTDDPLQVEFAVSAADLKRDMLDYSSRILGLSIFLSLLTGAVVYFVLNLHFVRPMRNLTAAMISFQEKPEDPNRVIAPHARLDEIGQAEQVLADMQHEIRAALRQKTRLAALGAAVAKINHDLRNILASAQLVSDRMSSSEDPRVQRLAPKLVKSLDRAVTLCKHTLRYGQAEEAPLNRQRIRLRELVDDLCMEYEDVAGESISLRQTIDEAVEVYADRDQLFRILSNLLKNAIEAVQDYQQRADGHEGVVEMRARRGFRVVEIEVVDNGPGLPERAHANLFQPFKGGARPGGAGLGLAIARELAQAHDGDVTLVKSDSHGAVFRVTLCPPPAS